MKTLNAIKFTFFFTFFLFFGQLSAQSTSTAELPNTYDFDYVYKLKITHKKNDAQLDYYLKKDQAYFGFDTSAMMKGNKDAKMFMVMDNQRGISAMFMEMMGKKMVQKSSLKRTSSMSDDSSTDFTFKKIGSKTILGYHCEGFEGENDDVKIVFYITNEVPVSFNQVWGADMKNMPRSFNPGLIEKYAENGLMMEMIFVDKNKDKNSMTMECIGLDKTDFSINTTTYGSMMGAFGN
ncbi:MAG: DUF4412 domain-containing protein [Algicola sp.]|nr:DUF4412 domain-containing protein [Algicola sp.]